MANSTTDWKNCRYGGPPSGDGHRVAAEKMPHTMCGKVTITICEDCKARKIGQQKNERMKNVHP